MENQAKFMELMQEVREIVSAQGREITKEEIIRYFQGMDLTEQHYNAVYQYLFENGIKIRDFAGKIYEKNAEGDGKEDGQAKAVNQSSKAGRKLSQKDEKAIARYRQALQGIAGLEKEEEEKLLEQLAVAREKRIKEAYITGKQHFVVNMAKQYCGRGIPAEELIQEGNMGLLHAVARIMDKEAEKPYAAMAEKEIRQSMEAAIDRQISEKDWENTMLAKTNLLHGAAEYLAEENGRVPTKEELAEYTRIPVSEITELFRLSAKAD